MNGSGGVQGGGMKIYDVHTHLQDNRLILQRDEVVRRSLEAGVVKIMCCGIHEQDWDRVLEMLDSYGAISASLGIHPWFVSSRSTHWEEALEMLIDKTGAAVGEIGLDRMTGYRNDSEQEEVFKRHLDIADNHMKPVSIHCRKAWGVMAGILKARGGLPYGGVVHSWSGSAEMVKVFEQLGVHISFSGSVTRPDNKKVRAACKAVSRERLLVETDSPDIIPSGVEAGLNEPAFILKVVETIAEIRGESVEEVADYTYKNALKLFGD